MSQQNDAVMQIAPPATQSYAIQAADPAAVAAAEAAKQRLQAAFVMAKQFPRDPDQARYRILNACRRKRFAEMAEYSKPVGSRKIVGPSIRLAELALREWGNIMAESTVVFEDEESRRIAEGDNAKYAQSTSDFEAWPVLHGKYLLLSLLGKGGYSEVYKAYDLE